MDSCCLSNGSQTLDPWPQPTNDSVDFQFENNFIPGQQTYQPLPDKEEYIKRLGKYLYYYIIRVLCNHHIILQYIIINMLFDTG